MRSTRGFAFGVCLLLAACGTAIERRSLATGQVDRPAYELNGTDLAALHQDAQRLCPDGADILRAASQGPAPASDAAAWRRWLTDAGNSLQAVPSAAQLVVVCRSATVSSNTGGLTRQP
jgi:hypothetical protein